MLKTGGNGSAMDNLEYKGDEKTRKYFKGFFEEVRHMYKRDTKEQAGVQLEKSQRHPNDKVFPLFVSIRNCSITGSKNGPSP